METAASRSRAVPSREEYWQAFVEYCLIGVAVADVDGRYIISNSIFRGLLGYSDQELPDMLLPDLTDEKETSGNGPFAELVKSEGGNFEREVHQKRKDGSLIWLKASIYLIPRTQTRDRFVIALLQDISNLKQAQGAAPNQSDELFHAVDTSNII